MGFNLGNALTGAAAGGATGGWGGALLGGVAGGMTPNTNYDKVSRSDVRMGHAEDTRSFKERDIYSWNQAQARGLNVSEYYGSSASGGSSSSGGANVLGNSQDKANQIKMQQSQETNERQKDRLSQIAQTKMQTDTQKQVAEIQTGTTKRGQDITQTTAANALSLSRDQYNNVVLPKVAAELKISEQQLIKATNETITSAPKWQLMMKRLTMGPDNIYVEAYIKTTGIDPTKEGSFSKLNDQQKKKFLDRLIAYKSRTAGEISGIARLFGLDNPSETHNGPPMLGAGNKKKKEIYSNPFFKIHKYE